MLQIFTGISFELRTMKNHPCDLHVVAVFLGPMCKIRIGLDWFATVLLMERDEFFCPFEIRIGFDWFAAVLLMERNEFFCPFEIDWRYSWKNPQKLNNSITTIQDIMKSRRSWARWWRESRVRQISCVEKTMIMRIKITHNWIYFSW